MASKEAIFLCSITTSLRGLHGLNTWRARRRNWAKPSRSEGQKAGLKVRQLEVGPYGSLDFYIPKTSAVDSSWNSWGSWGSCSADCGGGEKLFLLPNIASLLSNENLRHRAELEAVMWLKMAAARQAAPNWVRRRAPATPRTAVSFVIFMSYHITCSRSLGARWALTSSLQPYGPAWFHPSRPSGAQAVWPTQWCNDWIEH